MHMPPSDTDDPLEGHTLYLPRGPVSNGTFGAVRLYTNGETGEQVAIKFLERRRLTSHNRKYVEAEIINHRKLSSKASTAQTPERHCHPMIIGFQHVFLWKDHICIVMEYANGGNLSGHIRTAGGRLEERVARWLFQQLIIGIDFCHRKGVVNRDVKLENTLLQTIPAVQSPPLIKICDFGYSKASDMSLPNSKVGTIPYMAPEVIASFGPNAASYDGNLSDVWSCGVMLFAMLFGVFPFHMPMDAQATAELARLERDFKLNTHDRYQLRILNGLWRFPDAADVSPDCQDLLQKLLVTNPQQRLGIAGIQRHPWFLVNCPPTALTMSDVYLASNDYAGLQTEEEIRAIMANAAQQQAPPVAPGHVDDAPHDLEHQVLPAAPGYREDAPRDFEGSGIDRMFSSALREEGLR